MLTVASDDRHEWGEVAPIVCSQSHYNVRASNKGKSPTEYLGPDATSETDLGDKCNAY
jgi:hypothetical protein